MIKVFHALAAAAAAAAIATAGMCGTALAGTDPAADPAAGPAVGAARAASDDYPPKVTVMGEGELLVTPDIMRLNAGVEVRTDTPGQAFSQARQAAARLTRALLGAGIALKDLRTTELSLAPVYDDYPKIAGYRAAQGVEVVVRDLDNADKVVDTVVSVGPEARLNGVSFELSDNNAALRAARDLAFADAKARAQQYARLAGGRLGDVLTIREQDVTPPRPIMFAAAGVADRSSISPGQQNVSVHVQVVYSMMV
ncbi:SIMPL domain-containing protein [Streptosporangium sandarakinum]|uniref:SIMPL domain-containing protein n=1 Tax=Streptosporangium sandarakinum TaxID=1260955 RepID=UPI00343F8347